MLVYALETDDLETAETLGDVTRYSTPWIFLGLLVISVFTFNRGGSLYSLWHLMT